MSWALLAEPGLRRAGGLLLLRVGFTVTLLTVALGPGRALPPWAWWLGAVAGLGLLTGLLSCACAAASLGLLLWCASLPVGPPPWLLAQALAQGLALMLLGAGRWSVDRRLFGRRLVFDSDNTFG